MTQTDEAIPKSDPGRNRSDFKTRFDFFALPRSVQDRFLVSASGSGIPGVILFSPARKDRGVGWLMLLALSLGALLWAATRGFGDLTSAHALQGQLMTIVYVVAGAGALASLAGYQWASGRQRRYPYRLGSYLFPAGVLVAHDERLQLFPTTDLLSLESVGNATVAFKYRDRVFRFQLPGELTVERLRKTVEEHRAQLVAALETSSRKQLAVLDPIRDSGFSNPLSSKESLRRPKDQRLVRLLFAALLGGALGVVCFLVRNKLAERSIYAEARKLDTGEAYQAYLAQGGTRADVREILLPRAHLKAARGSLVEVERYAAENPQSNIKVEIDAALREELLGELKRARRAGTLGAIEAFQKAHPTHVMIGSEITKARAEVFKIALLEFEQSHSPSAKVLGFFTALVSHSEQHGPEVEIRFRRHVPKSAERADNQIKRSAYFTGRHALPSQYLSQKHAHPREQQVAQRVREHLQRAFSKEVLHFQIGEFLEGKGPLPEFDKPTLFVSYTTEMSGGYTTQSPRGVYVGLGMMVKVDFVIPNTEQRLTFKDSSWLPPDINLIWRDGLKPGQVYDLNARTGFRRFTDRYLSELLPKAAERQ